MKKRSLLLMLALVSSIVLIGLAVKARMGPVHQEALSDARIFAYRGWQSVGRWVHKGDRLEIRAEGTWLYTPGEYHGPEGHRRYQSPSFYPLPGVPGGALIGRIGEGGKPFYVGKNSTRRADGEGLLYLRIDDDVLSDNEGYVTVEVTIEPGGASD